MATAGASHRGAVAVDGCLEEPAGEDRRADDHRDHGDPGEHAEGGPRSSRTASRAEPLRHGPRIRVRSPTTVRAHRSRGGSGWRSRIARKGQAVGLVCRGDGATRVAAGEMLRRATRRRRPRARPSGAGRRDRGRARGRPACRRRRRWIRLIGDAPRDGGRRHWSRPRLPRARSAARAWRRLSRARVSKARAATWLTPSAAASSTPVRSCSSASRRAARWRSGIRAARAACRRTGGRPSPGARRTAPNHAIRRSTGRTG